MSSGGPFPASKGKVWVDHPPPFSAPVGLPGMERDTFTVAFMYQKKQTLSTGYVCPPTHNLLPKPQLLIKIFLKFYILDFYHTIFCSTHNGFTDFAGIECNTLTLKVVSQFWFLAILTFLTMPSL